MVERTVDRFDNPKISLSDRHCSIRTENGVVTVGWESGLKTSHPVEEFEANSECRVCEKDITPVEGFQYEGRCRSCYAKYVLNIPAQFRNETTVYRWEFPVTQTKNKSDRGIMLYRADCFDRNFGVGDSVLLNPSRKKPQPEGKVLELHQFTIEKAGTSWWMGNNTYMAKVDLGKGKPAVFIPSFQLEAITNGHVTFERLEEIRDMVDVPAIGYDPMPERLVPIFEDNIARAIYIAYRRSHIVDQYTREALEVNSPIIAQKIREAHMPRERLALWFLKNMRPEFEEELAVFMVPYLREEKTATYVTKPATTD